MVLSWVLHLDPDTIAMDKAKWEAKAVETEKAKEERKRLRDLKKQEEATTAQNAANPV